MDPRNSAQDVVRCTLCQTSVAPKYCEVCHTHLCEDCEKKHLSASFENHKVVSLQQYFTTLTYPKCKKHPTEHCKLHCRQCDIPICTQCVSSKKHLRHTQTEILKKSVLHRELHELEKIVYPTYQEIASNIQMQKTDLNKNSQKLTTDINNQGKLWHNKIDTVIKNFKSHVVDMESKHLVVLKIQEEEITRIISEISDSIVELKKLLNSKNVCLVSEYKSRNPEFKQLPSKLKVSLPNFKSQEIHIDQLTEQFGSLSALSFTIEEQDYVMPTQGAESSPPDRSLMSVPRIISSIDTMYEHISGVTCLNDTEIWTRGLNNIMNLYNLQGDLLKSIQTNTGNNPWDIAVTRSGELLYTDYHDRTVNIVKNTQVQTVIRLEGWKPLNICSTLSGDLLVVMDSDDKDDDDSGGDEDAKQTKVVRYSGSKKKQSIQYNDAGEPLFSSGDTKYISENRNRDICVSDHDASAVVVVNQAGKLRFTYTGNQSPTKRQFSPRGITTDSKSRLLVLDCNNHCIHILDQDGQFLRYIENCHLQLRIPMGLCVDTKDNLFLAEWDTGKLKKIQYSM
nr:uncharacterized protein LOC105318413 [Crassostrea gigas]